jgi:transitional endoplasmic reticulum ATPase
MKKREISNNQLKLRVVEALPDDAYKGIVRIDPTLMRQLGLERGDIISIKGDRETYSIIDRAYPADLGEGIIRMDGITRKNAKTRIEEIVEVRKANIKEAKKITVAPAQQGIVVQANPANFKRGLLGKPVVKGDLVVLGGSKRRKDLMSEGLGDLFGGDMGEIFNQMGLGGAPGGLTQLRFAIASTNPGAPCLITENTVITISSKAVEISEESIPQITYEDIGGLREEVKKVREMVELPLKRPEIFARLGIEPPQGVLLYGPPGTGKTLLAKAVANESEAHFILLNGPEIMSKFYGESEKKIRELFDDAEKNAPSIIFIDELDSLAPKREDSTGEVERRVVSQLLTMMDGLKTRGKVVVIGATNRPEAIDPALRRPGRFDREVEISVPDREGRLSILKIHTRGMPIRGTIYQDTVAKVFSEHIEKYLKKNKVDKDKLEERLNSLKRERSKDHEGLFSDLKSKLTFVKKRIEKLEGIKKLIQAKKELENLSRELVSIYSTLELRGSDDTRRIFIEKTKNKKESEVANILEEIEDLDLFEKDIWDIESSFWDDIRLLGKKKDLGDLARKTHGFVGADISSLAKEAAMNVLRRNLHKLPLEEDKEIPQEILEGLKVSKNDFDKALKIVRPSAMREVLVETPNTKWNDIGGVDGVKRDLKEAVEWPLKYPEAFSRMGIRPPKGVLLYGPPGTGKTLLAKAVANESEANFIQVKGPSLLSMWVGKSEEGVRKIFERARQVSPCVVFFDEIDSLAGKRGGSSIGGTKVVENVLNQLLAEMDGIEDLHNVIVIGATNRPDILDPALMRPGRFDRIVYVPVPEEEGRHKILKIHTKNMQIDKSVNLLKIAEETEGYTGADIESLCREAAMLALREDINALNVTKGDFEKAMEKVRPSVSKNAQEQYKQIEQKYLKSARAALAQPGGTYTG